MISWTVLLFCHVLKQSHADDNMYHNYYPYHKNVVNEWRRHIAGGYK